VGDQLVAPRGRVHRHAPEAWLEADEAAEARGDADRTGAVRAERQWRQARRNGCRSSAGGSTRRAREVPGIARLAEQSVIGRAAPGELGQVGPADEDRPGRVQARYARGVLRRSELREQARAVSGALAGRPEIVFDRDGHAMKRAERLAAHHRPLGRASFTESALGVDHDVGAQPWVQPVDPLQHSAGDLDRRQGAATDQLRQLDGGREAEVGSVHVSAARPEGPPPAAAR
jgi:hypothetical protein